MVYRPTRSLRPAHRTINATSAGAAGGGSCELVQQRLGVPEIGGVKALGKPRVDVSEQVVRLPPFPLLVPEPTETHRGPQLERSRLLAAGEVQGPLEPGFRLGLRCPRLPQEEARSEAIQLRLDQALSRALRSRQCLVQSGEPRLDLLILGVGVSQQPKKERLPDRAPRLSHCRQALSDLADLFSPMAKHGLRA